MYQNLKRSFLLAISVLFVLLASALNLQAKKYDLGLKLEQGQEYKHLTQAEINIQQEIMGQTMDIRMEIQGSMVFRVEEVLESSYSLRTWYEDMDLNMSITMGDMDLSQAMGNLDEIMGSMLDSMMNIPFNVQLSTKGMVLEINGMDRVWESGMEQFSELPTEQRKQIQQQLSTNFGDKALKGNIEQITAIFPDKAVKPGQTWQVETLMESGFKVKSLSTFELVAVEEGRILIRASSVLATLESDDWVETNGMKAKYSMEGKMESDIQLDPLSCWVLKSSFVQDMQGHAQMQESVQFPDGLELPMKIHNETIITAE